MTDRTCPTREPHDSADLRGTGKTRRRSERVKVFAKADAAGPFAENDPEGWLLSMN